MVNGLKKTDYRRVAANKEVTEQANLKVLGFQAGYFRGMVHKTEYERGYRP